MNKIVSVILILIAVSCYSQDTYPKKILLGSDTVVAITQSQQKSINLLIDKAIHYKKLSDSLGYAVERVKFSRTNLLTINSSLKNENSSLNRINNNQVLRIDNLRNDLTQTKVEVTDLKLKRKKLARNLLVSVLINMTLFSMVMAAK